MQLSPSWKDSFCAVLSASGFYAVSGFYKTPNERMTTRSATYLLRSSQSGSVGVDLVKTDVFFDELERFELGK